MLLFSRPNDPLIRAFLDAEKQLPYSYPEIGLSQHEDPVAGYDNDLNTIELGRGEGVWLAAKEAVRQWKMFPGGWSYITTMKVWHGTLNAAGFGWLVLHGWVQASKAQENA